MRHFIPGASDESNNSAGGFNFNGENCSIYKYPKKGPSFLTCSLSTKYPPLQQLAPLSLSPVSASFALVGTCIWPRRCGHPRIFDRGQFVPIAEPSLVPPHRLSTHTQHVITIPSPRPVDYCSRCLFSSCRPRTVELPLGVGGDFSRIKANRFLQSVLSRWPPKQLPTIA